MTAADENKLAIAVRALTRIALSKKRSPTNVSLSALRRAEMELIARDACDEIGVPYNQGQIDVVDPHGN